MKKVNVPNFYIALALKGNYEGVKEVGQVQLESLRLATSDYLVQKLQKTSYPTLARLELNFTYLSCGSNDKFDLYWEVAATASFTSHKRVPRPDDLWERVGAEFDKDFLLDVVQVVGRKDDSPLASAFEVEAKRITTPSKGGTVQAPAFYMGFVCSQEPDQNLTDEEKQKLTHHFHQEAIRHLDEEYPNGDFEKIKIKIVKTEIGERAGKPDEEFKLYVQFEAVGTFAQNAPNPMELFVVLTKCMSLPFLSGLSNVAVPFEYVVRMAIRVCIWIEFPVLEDEDGAGEGEAEPVALIVRVHLEFFVALVVHYLERLPGFDKLDSLDELLMQYFFTLLRTWYPGEFVDLELRGDPQFQANTPLPRFNMLENYKATLQFYDPAPDSTKILAKILECDTTVLLKEIGALSSPWDQVDEVTLGKATTEATKAKSYGGKVEIEEEDIPSPEPEKKTIKPKIKKPTSPKKKKEQKKQQPLVVVEEKKIEEVVTTPITGKKLRTSDVYLALTIANCDSEPTKEDYDALTKAVKEFYAKRLMDVFGGDVFQDIQLRVALKLFGDCSGKVDERYNFYVEWDIQTSWFTDKNIAAPDRQGLCRAIVTAPLMDLLKNNVRTLKDTPFVDAIGIYTQQVVFQS